MVCPKVRPRPAARPPMPAYLGPPPSGRRATPTSTGPQRQQPGVVPPALWLLQNDLPNKCSVRKRTLMQRRAQAAPPLRTIRMRSKLARPHVQSASQAALGIAAVKRAAVKRAAVRRAAVRRARQWRRRRRASSALLRLLAILHTLLPPLTHMQDRTQAAQRMPCKLHHWTRGGLRQSGRFRR
jgi:hypothetical protein